MEPWQRFGRQRLAQSRWNCEPAAIAAVDRQIHEALVGLRGDDGSIMQPGPQSGC